MFGSAVFTSFNYLGLPRPGTERRSSEKKSKKNAKTEKREKNLCTLIHVFDVYEHIFPQILLCSFPLPAACIPPPPLTSFWIRRLSDILYNWTLHRIGVYQDLDWTISNEERAWDTADTSWTTKWSVYQRQKTTNHAYAHM